MEGGKGGESRDAEEELHNAASFLIREWVEKVSIIFSILQYLYRNVTNELTLNLFWTLDC